MPRNRKLFDFLKRFAVFAGNLALPYYGKVETQFKQIEIAQKMHESPVTVIDHAIQELLLAEMVRRGFTDVAFNGEEDTHLKFFFRTDYENGVTVHCDPIDGTRSFATGKNRFSTGFGLSRAKNGKHEFFASVMYAPLEKKLYWAYEDDVSTHKKNEDPPKTFAGRRALNALGLERLAKLGYVPADPGNSHMAIVDIALGRMGAYGHWPIQVHDALIPFAFARNYGVIPTDEHGKPLHTFTLHHTSKGFARIPKICFFANSKIKDDFIPVLQNPKYVN